MIYYIDTDSTLAGIKTAAGDTCLFKAGCYFTPSKIPSGFFSPSNLTIGLYGTGNKPVFNAGITTTAWTYDAVNNVYASMTFASNVLGNVTENGIPMKFTAWNADIATTAKAMVSGSNSTYWAGSMTYDPVKFIVYIRPSTGTASQHSYNVSNTLYGFMDTAVGSNLWIDSIVIRHASRHGILLQNKTNPKITNVDMNVIGGRNETTWYLGNGIELSGGCVGALTQGCTFTDIFDSAVTSQLYESVATTLSNHTWDTLTVNNFGMTAVETSCQTPNQTIKDITVSNITANNGGMNNWSGNRGGIAVTFLTQGGGSKVTNSYAHNVKSTNCASLYLGSQTAGINGIENSTGTGSYSKPPQSSQGSSAAQLDLYLNVTDNLGAPVGSTWAQSTVPLSTYAAVLA